MNEKAKLKEAQYFLQKMKEIKANYDEFVFNLSAFISASRSIMQYIYNETKSNGNLSWYESKMSSSDILKFFKSTRNLNIHVIPYKLRKDVTIKVPTLSFSTSIGYTSISSSGNVFVSSPLSQLDMVSKCETIDTYKFDPDWYDQLPINRQFTQADKVLCKSLCQSYDVIAFSDTYINELTNIVTEGITAGYISG